MRLITVTNPTTGTSVHREVSRDDLAALSGVQLAAALFPNPTPEDATAITAFLAHRAFDTHHRNGTP